MSRIDREVHAWNLTLTLTVVLTLLALGAPGASAQAPNIELHELDFYIHVDTLAADPLALYEGWVDDALIDARLILQGEQGGPVGVETACCTELTRRVSLTVVGTPGDGLDVIDFGVDLPTLQGEAGGRP